MAVNVSFICRHCGGHVRKGNHAKCKKILMRQRAEELKQKNTTEAIEERKRVKAGSYVQKQYREREGFAKFVNDHEGCKPLDF